MKKRRTKFALNLLSAVAIAALVPHAAKADHFFGIDDSEISKFLLIGPAPASEGDSIDISNFEIGAIKNDVPADSNSLLGPDLANSQPELPANIVPIGQGVDFSGNVAVVHPTGRILLSDTGVYADPNIGIRCANPSADGGTTPPGSSVSGCVQASNSFFNDSNLYPNTYTPDPGGSPIGGTGSPVTSNPADEIDETDANPNGVFVDQDFSAATGTGLFDHLFTGADSAKSIIPNLPTSSTATISHQVLDFGSDGTLQASDGDGVLVTGAQGGTTRALTVDLMSGLNVIDLVAGTLPLQATGMDFNLNNMTLIVDGPADAFAIFRVPDGSNFLPAYP